MKFVVDKETVDTPSNINGEDFIYFQTYEGINTVHGGEELFLKKSRWEGLGSPLTILVDIKPGNARDERDARRRLL